MSQFDPDTGMVLSDLDEIQKEANLDDNDNGKAGVKIDLVPPDENDSKSSEQKPSKINKRLISVVAASLVALVVFVSILSPSQKKKKVQGNAVASELTVPDFSMEAVYTKSELPEIQSQPLPEIKPVYMTHQQPIKEAASTQTIQQPSNGYSDVPPQVVSTIIPEVQGRLLGQEIQAGPSAQEQNPYMKAMSALGIPMGQDEYTASRLSELGNLSGSGIGGTNQATGVNTYQEQNMQSNKQSFYSSGRKEEATGSYIAENTLWTGTIIPGVLITGINTDLPGDVQARVTENIYDSLSRKRILISQGSILIASYNSSIAFAQNRVQIAWNTLIRPDGYQVTLGNMNGVDAQGYSGTQGKVDDHLFQYAKAAGIISAFTTLNGEFAATLAGTTNTSLQNLITANQGVMNQMGANIIERTLNIQPTLIVKSGTKINIMLNKNIRFPPMEEYPVKSVYKRK